MISRTEIILGKFITMTFGIFLILGTFDVYKADIIWITLLAFIAIWVLKFQYADNIKVYGVKKFSEEIKKHGVVTKTSNYLSYFLLFLFVASWFSDIDFYMPYLYLLFMTISMATLVIADLEYKKNNTEKENTNV